MSHLHEVPPPGSEDHDSEFINKVIANASGWYTTNDDYDEFTFYTKSTDSQGHREKQTCRFPPWMKDAMGAIVASQKYQELGSIEAVIRDAVYHRLHWMGLNLKGMAGVTDLTRMHHLQTKAEEATKQRQAILGLIGELNQHVEHLSIRPSKGGYGQVSDLLGEAVSIASTLPDTDYRQDFEAAINRWYETVRNVKRRLDMGV